MIRLNSTASASARAHEAQPAGQEPEERDAQRDDFSMLLANLFIITVPSAQNGQALSAETAPDGQSQTDACVQENGQLSAQAVQSSIFSGPNGFQVDPNNQSSAPDFSLTSAFEQLQQGQPTMQPSDVFNPVGGNSSQLLAQQQSLDAAARAQLLAVENLTAAGQSSAAGKALDLNSWPNNQLLETDALTARGHFSSTVAAALNLINDERQTTAGSTGQLAASEVDAVYAEPLTSAAPRLDSAQLAGVVGRLPAPRHNSLEGDAFGVHGEDRGPQQTFPRADPNITPAVEMSADTTETSTDAGQHSSHGSQYATTAATSAVSATAAASSSVAAREVNTTESIAAQVAHALRETAGEIVMRRETRAIRIRLRPEELGEVQINLTTDQHGRLNAHINAEQEATRQALASGLDHLREVLEQAGINLGQLDVGYHQHAGAGQQAQTDVGARQPTMPAGVVANHAVEALASDGTSTGQEDRLVSLRA